MKDDKKFFQTRDERLALALINAGCTLAPQDQGGPCDNIYTPADMRSKGMLKQGSASIEEFEEAVRRASGAKRKGIVTFYIVHDATFERAIKAWDDIAAEFEAAKGENRAPVVPKIGEVVAMQVAYMLRMNTALLRDIAFVRTPILSTMEGTTTEAPVPNRTKGVNESSAPAGREITTGSGAAWTLGLSHEKKKALGII